MGLTVQIPGPHPKSNKSELNTPYVVLMHNEVWESLCYLTARQGTPVRQGPKLGTTDILGHWKVRFLKWIHIIYMN